MKILIGYDGSECSKAAIEDLKLAGFPQTVDALVMSVADVILPPPLTEAEDIFPPTAPHGVRLAHVHAESKLYTASAMASQTAEQVKRMFPSWNVNHEAIADSPAWALIRKAEEWKSDLVVVGAHGHSVLGGRLILGSVSQRVLYEARCSVRIARARAKERSGPLRILIGIDNSLHSNEAIKEVGRRHWSNATEVRLLAVVDTVMSIPNPDEPEVLKWVEVADEENWDQIRAIFLPSVNRLQRVGLNASTMIRRGNPKKQLLEEAESWGADCIFVGAKGVRGIDRLLLGSVSSATSARADCTVEVVRPKIGGADTGR